MTIKEIAERLNNLEVFEKRSVSDDYLEIVFYNKDIDKWNQVLSDILGAVIKPQGVKPAKEDLQLTKEHGGIRKEQTLYKKDFGDFGLMAMFWPWQNKIHTTLKVILLKK